MKIRFAALLLSLFVYAGPASATLVYDNSTTDTLNTIVYNANAYSQIGDSITLSESNPFLTDATVQFYNISGTGTFSATLRFWELGAPVGSQLGSSYVVNNIAANEADLFNVTFADLNLFVPTNVIFSVEVSNIVGNLALGLNLFEPPTVGSSDNTFFIAEKNSAFSQESVGVDQANLYFVANAAAVPEPCTAALAGAALLTGLFRSRKRRAL